MFSYKQLYAALCSYVFISQSSTVEAQTSSTVYLTNTGENTWVKHSQYGLFAYCIDETSGSASECQEIIYPGKSQYLALDQDNSFFGLNYLSCASGTDASVFYPYDIASCSIYHAESFTAEINSTQLQILEPIRVHYSTTTSTIETIKNYEISISSKLPAGCTLSPPTYYADGIRRVLYYPGLNTNENLQYPESPYTENYCLADKENFDTIARPFSIEYALPNASQPPDFRPGSYLWGLMNDTQYLTDLGYYVILDCYGCGTYYSKPVGTNSSQLAGKQYANLLGEISEYAAKYITNYHKIIYSLMSHTTVNGRNSFDGTTHMLNLQKEAWRNINKNNLVLFGLNNLGDVRNFGSNKSGLANDKVFTPDNIEKKLNTTNFAHYGFMFRMFFNPDNTPDQSVCVSPVSLCLAIQQLDVLTQWLEQYQFQNIFFGETGGNKNSANCDECKINATAGLMAITESAGGTGGVGAWGTGSPMVDPRTGEPDTTLYLSNTSIAATYGQTPNFLIDKNESNAPTTQPSILTTPPSGPPTTRPSLWPSHSSSTAPSFLPSDAPTDLPRTPTHLPSAQPVASNPPSNSPAAIPSQAPYLSIAPSKPTQQPTTYLRPNSTAPTNMPSHPAKTSSRTTTPLIERAIFLFPVIFGSAFLFLLFVISAVIMRYYPNSLPGKALWNIFCCCIGINHNRDDSEQTASVLSDVIDPHSRTRYSFDARAEIPPGPQESTTSHNPLNRFKTGAENQYEEEEGEIIPRDTVSDLTENTSLSECKDTDPNNSSSDDEHSSNSSRYLRIRAAMFTTDESNWAESRPPQYTASHTQLISQ